VAAVNNFPARKPVANPGLSPDDDDSLVIEGIALMKRTSLVAVLILVAIVRFAAGQQAAANAKPTIDTSRGDKMLADYFAAETKKLQDNCLAEIKTLDDWKAHRDEYRRQLHEMLGLDPLPEIRRRKPARTCIQLRVNRLQHVDAV